MKNLQALKAALMQAENELEADGWVNILSVMHDGGGLEYGVLYKKDGVKFYLNKDTICAGMPAPMLAKAFESLFNK